MTETGPSAHTWRGTSSLLPPRCPVDVFAIRPKHPLPEPEQVPIITTSLLHKLDRDRSSLIADRWCYNRTSHHAMCSSRNIFLAFAAVVIVSDHFVRKVFYYVLYLAVILHTVLYCYTRERSTLFLSLFPTWERHMHCCSIVVILCAENMLLLLLTDTWRIKSQEDGSSVRTDTNMFRNYYTAVSLREGGKMSVSSTSSTAGAIAADKDGKKTQRDFRLDVLVAIFGMSSWISVNGLWVQLPVIVNE